MIATWSLDKYKLKATFSLLKGMTLGEYSLIDVSLGWKRTGT